MGCAGEVLQAEGTAGTKSGDGSKIAKELKLKWPQYHGQ